MQLKFILPLNLMLQGYCPEKYKHCFVRAENLHATGMFGTTK